MHTYWTMLFCFISAIILIANLPTIIGVFYLIIRRPAPQYLIAWRSGDIIRTRDEMDSERIISWLSSTALSSQMLAAERQARQAIWNSVDQLQEIELPTEIVVREEREMRRRAELSNVVTLTSTVVHVPTIAELAMVESATAFFVSKLIGTINRNAVREAQLKGILAVQSEAYLALVSRMHLGTDSEFVVHTPEARVIGINLTQTIQALAAYMETSVRGSSSVPRASYMSETFIRNSLRSICSSYLGFKWDNAAKKLSIHTDSITLSHVSHGTNFTVPLGRFEVVWNAEGFTGTNGNPTQFKIFALDEGFHARNNPRVIHPHVSSNNMCPGDANTGVQTRLPLALNEGRISDAFDLIDGLLHNYGGYPYVHLEHWGNHLCPGCRDSIQIDQMVQCFQCAAGHCRNCSKQCEECDRWFCKERCGIFHQETRTYTCPCTLNTVRCNGCQQRFDPTTPLGNMDPVNGYCPHCLYLWITGVTPTPATRVRPQPVPSNPFDGLTVPLAVPVPNPATPVPRRATPLTRVPNVTSSVAPVLRVPAAGRPQRVEFENNYDDLLESEAALLQQRLDSVVIGTPRLVENVEQLAAAVDMLHDINGNAPVVTHHELDADTEPSVVETTVDSVIQTAESIVDEFATRSETVSIQTPVAPAIVSTSPNRYRDPITGRWVL